MRQVVPPRLGGDNGDGSGRQVRREDGGGECERKRKWRRGGDT